MTLECRVSVNIMGADTKDIGGKAYGQMLLRLPEDEASVERIFSYLERHGLKYDEINDVKGGQANE